MGLAIAHSPAIFHSPKYGPAQAWEMKSISELTIYAKRFLALMKSQPYGPYEATKLVFGTEVADSLAQDTLSNSRQYLAPPLRQSVLIQRRRRQRSNSSDNNDGDDPDQPSSQRMRR